MSDSQSPVQRMMGGRASRNVLLTLLGAGVVGGGMWGTFGGNDCTAQRFPTREACEVARGAGQCRPATAGVPEGPWAAANCPTMRYVPRSYSSWWGGSSSYGRGSISSPPTQARSGTGGRFDAPAPSGSRVGSSGSSRRGGFGSIGSAHSGSS